MKVAIAGYGVEGRASFKHWASRGHEVTIVDERPLSPYELPYGARSITGKGAFKSLSDFDLVVRTASLPPSKLKTKSTVWSATNEFFAECPVPIIGVTGTKGKGTTASLIAEILRAAGRTVHLVGNIGVAALEVLPSIKKSDIVVYELSSFQLWDAKQSPHIAVVLMIEPDHLDVHKNLKDYVGAKANIRKHQGLNDVCIYHPTSPDAAKIAHASHDGHGAFRYGIKYENQAYVKESTFFVQNTAICGVETLQVVGKHNIENACAAISAAWLYTQDTDAITRGLHAFTGLPHRLKHVRDFDSVSYYDDSIATTPGSAIAALQSFTRPKVLILGGTEKGGEYGGLIKLCAQTDTQVVTMGANGQKLAKLCKKAGVQVTDVRSKSIDDVVSVAAKIAHKNGVVILSPAASSFDMFKSYADRGDQFAAAVNGLS